jgi:hypothetical protein
MYIPPHFSLIYFKLHFSLTSSAQFRHTHPHVKSNKLKEPLGVGHAMNANILPYTIIPVPKLSSRLIVY